MKKLYCTPKVALLASTHADVITTSVGSTDAGVNDIGFFEK